MQEMQIQSLGLDDLSEEEISPHSSILAWKKSHGQRRLVDYSPWGHKESDMAEATEHIALFYFKHRYRFSYKINPWKGHEQKWETYKTNITND